MALFIFDCPYCHATRMSGKILSSYVVPTEHSSNLKVHPRAYISTNCGACWMPVVGEVSHPGALNPGSHSVLKSEFTKAANTDYAIDTGPLKAEVVLTPEQSSELPDHLSTAVAKAYRSAERNRQMEDGEDAAATMYRRAIDVAIREKYPDVKGNLAPRIEKLAERQAIPPALKDWADHIRWIGADGAHEPEGVTPEEVEVLRGFTEAFLRYLITLPFQVNYRRGLIDKEGIPITNEGLVNEGG